MVQNLWRNSLSDTLEGEENWFLTLFRRSLTPRTFTEQQRTQTCTLADVHADSAVLQLPFLSAPSNLRLQQLSFKTTARPYRM